MKKIFAFALISLAAMNAAAEKADAGKQAVIEYDSLHVDDVTQVTTLTGNVIVTKGTLVLKADKAVIRQTPDDDMQVTLTTTGSKPANFRQKRDGGPALYVEGEAQRIEYDERSAVMKLFSGARIRQIDGERLTDEIQSEFISYDSIREVFAARNDASGTTKPGAVRGKMIIAPRKPKAAPAGTAPATPPAAPVTPAPTGTP
ncbi:MAG TPA: lipopolysaccharide transport periplasmic protein LptA [Telluria sp.]|nr:lipopolysaccharide transport periplasmic protein LptA [Telluria sp.]